MDLTKKSLFIKEKLNKTSIEDKSNLKSRPRRLSMKTSQDINKNIKIKENYIYKKKGGIAFR